MYYLYDKTTKIYIGSSESKTENSTYKQPIEKVGYDSVFDIDNDKWTYVKRYETQVNTNINKSEIIQFASKFNKLQTSLWLALLRNEPDQIEDIRKKYNELVFGDADVEIEDDTTICKYCGSKLDENGICSRPCNYGLIQKEQETTKETETTDNVEETTKETETTDNVEETTKETE